MKSFRVGKHKVGDGSPFLLIAGPCVIETEKIAESIAGDLKDICESLDIPLAFKASYDKANRSSARSFRGPGLEEGLAILERIKKKTKLPVVSDIHAEDQVAAAGETLDIIQIPAFLCRQTDIVQAAARTGRVVNVKKGQFLAPWDARNIVDKIEEAGSDRIILTERGSVFGYNNLVVDFKGIPIMRQMGYPVCMDVTHSVQLPGGAGATSGGQREFVPHLTRAAMAVGVDALFMEVHHNPDAALSDGPNMISLSDLPELLKTAKSIDNLVKRMGAIS